MNTNNEIPILSNEIVTLIAVPLQIFQQTADQQSLVEQNVYLKTLSDGSIVIDADQALNWNNSSNSGITSTSDNNAKSIENSELVLTIEENDENIVNEQQSNFVNKNNGTKKEVKNTSKIRYLNSKSNIVDGRKGGRPKKDSLKLSSPDSDKKGPFICKFCNKEFEKWLIFKRHEKSHVHEKKYKCTMCPSSFNILSNHVLHLATHKTEDPTCPECGKKFHRIASLKAHIMYHVKEETFYCEECDTVFDNDNDMTEHVKDHGQVKKEMVDNFKCKYCQISFTDHTSFKKHTSEHYKMRSILQSPARKKSKTRTTIERKHQCNICSKAFQKLSQIERHLRVHSGEKPFICKVCDRGFSQKGSLHIHMSRHTGNKPHKCSLCQAKFIQKGNLRAHILKTHSIPQGGQNVYCCSECSCVFKRLGSLNGHMTRNHPKDKNNDIKFVLSQLSALQSNMGIDNNLLQQTTNNKSDMAEVKNLGGLSDNIPTATYVTLADLGLDGNIRQYVIKQRKVGDIRWHLCSYCPKEFKKPSDLLRHLRVHTREKPYVCKHCNRSFAIKSTLTTHMKIHTKCTKVQCKFCHKFFSSWNSLNTHVLKHTGPKRKCNVCNKCFGSKSQLTQHRKIHMMNQYYEGDNSNSVMLQPIQITSRGLEPVSSLRKRPLLEAGCKTRPYTCNTCGGGFRKLSHLKQHYILKHTTERPYTCHLCYRNFGSKSILKSHAATHTGTKPYECVVCKKKFTTNGSLKRHMVVHILSKPFICPVCFLDFKTLIQCKKHIGTHTSNDLNLHMETVENCQLIDTGTSLTNTIAEESTKAIIDEVQNSTTVVTQNIRTDETSSIILPANTNRGNLTQENIHVIEDTLNSQMLNIIGSENYVDTSTYIKKLDASQPITTTDGLVNTLTGSTESEKHISIDDNSFLYHQVIVNLSSESEQIPILDNNGMDNIVSQFKLQNDPLFLTDLNSININETNNVLLPFQSDVQQNQLIMLPSELEQEIQPVQINNLNSNLQLNRFLHPVQDIQENIVLNTTPIETNSEFLNNVEEGNISVALTDLSGLSGKSGDHNLLTEILPAEKQNSSIENVETTDVTCNLCKLNFKSKQDLKLHQCINIIKVRVDAGVVDDDMTRTVINREEINDSGDELDVLHVKDKCMTQKEFQEFVEKQTKLDSKKSKDTSNSTLKYKNQCTYCPKSFRKLSDLQRHLRTHTGERPFKCLECDKSFSLKSILKSHIKVHEGKKEFTCLVCNCLFVTKGSLNVHMRLHTGLKPFKCSICHLKFRTSGHRKAHIMGHYKQIIKTGKISTDGVSRKTKMSDLMKNVENIINANIKTDQTNKDENELQINLENRPIDQNLQLSLPVESNIQNDKPLNMHFEIETNTEGQIVNIKPTASHILFTDEISKKQIESRQVEFDEKTKKQIENFIRDKEDKKIESKAKMKKICNVCNKEFNTKYLLDRHSKIHTGERIFSCNYCTKTFNQKNTLQIHVRTHFGSRPYSCPHCSNSFSQIGNLKTHIKRIHSSLNDHLLNAETAEFIIIDNN